MYYSLQRTAQTGYNQNRKRSGRPRCTTKQEDKYIRVSSLRNRCLTGPQLAASLNGTRKTPVSTSTVKRQLRDAGLLGRAAKKKPYKRKRLRWAKEDRHWTDESKFEVFGSQRRTFVRRRTSEKMLEECLTASVKHGGGNVIVWGCFGAGKVGDLYKVKGILNKEGYHSILQCHALWTALDWSQFPPTTGQWPKAHLQTMQELFREEAVSWYSVCNRVASAVTKSQLYWAVVGAAWPYCTQEVPIRPIQLVGGTSGSVGWNFFRLPQQIDS